MANGTALRMRRYGEQVVAIFIKKPFRKIERAF